MTPLGPSPGNSWRVSETHADLVRAQVPVRPLPLDALPKPVTIDLARTGIIVIDMQDDFCHSDGWLASLGVDISQARAPIAPLVAVLPRLRAAGVPVIWVNWGTRPDRLNLSPALRHVYDPAGGGQGLRYASRQRGARLAGWQPVGPDCRGAPLIACRGPRCQTPYERVLGHAA